MRRSPAVRIMRSGSGVSGSYRYLRSVCSSMLSGSSAPDLASSATRFIASASSVRLP